MSYLIINYMYRVKNFTQCTIKENPDLKDAIEEEYYRLLVKIAKNQYVDRDLREYYFTIKNMKNYFKKY